MSTSVRRGMNRPSRSSRIVPPRFSTVKNVPERGSSYRSHRARSNSAVTRFRDLHPRRDESSRNQTPDWSDVSANIKGTGQRSPAIRARQPEHTGVVFTPGSRVSLQILRLISERIVAFARRDDVGCIVCSREGNSIFPYATMM